MFEALSSPSPVVSSPLKMFKTVILTLGAFMLIKAILVVIAEKSVVHWALKLSRDKNKVREIALLEIIIALIFIMGGYLA